ncbi:helix-turn-helix domain-containing protein [Microbacterium invictum]|uniref:helix-turn-helix domain-containing protein n=1 Tax=Microbacterium invictum TaxID=515415 RepID=UPI003A0FC5DD
MPGSDLPTGLAKPALRALDEAGLRTLRDVAGRPRDEIAALHGVGPRRVSRARRRARRGGAALRELRRVSY